MALLQVRQLPEIIQDVHTWSALPTRQLQFYRYCQAEEEKRERGRQGRQSEIYAQRDDAVSALLARAAVVTTASNAIWITEFRETDVFFFGPSNL